MNTIIKLWAITAMLVMPMTVHAQVVVGEAAKDFTLTDTKGTAYHLADLKGKYVVLEWFNHDCPFVKKQYDSGNMQQLQHDYTDKGVVWLSINSSAPGKQGQYSAKEADQLTQDKKASPTAVLLDPDGTVGRLYAAQTTPHMYIINPDGVLIYQGAIDDKPSADPADVATSKNYVRTALDEALAGSPITTPVTKSYGCSVKY